MLKKHQDYQMLKKQMVLKSVKGGALKILE